MAWPLPARRYGTWEELRLLLSRHMQCSDNLLLLGPGRFSFDAGIAHELLQEPDSSDSEEVASSAALRPIPVTVNGR